MEPTVAFWHLVNFAAPSLALGLLAALAAKGLWRAELAGVPWRGLAWRAASAALSVAVLGLAITGQDGRMLTYAGMVLACATVLYWFGFKRPLTHPGPPAD